MHSRVVTARSDHYAEAAAVTVVAVLAYLLSCSRLYVLIVPGRRDPRLIQRWAASEDVDRVSALRATYSYGRNLIRGG